MAVIVAALVLPLGSPAIAATTVGPGVHEQSISAIQKSGTWTTYQSAKDSGGSSFGGQSTSAVVQLTFKGTGVTWVARKNYWSGIGNVYIDGTKVAAVDLYSQTQLFQQNVFTKTGLTNATHTIRIERANTNRSPSTGRDINVDAIRVIDSTAPAAPTGVKTAVSPSSIAVSWTANKEADLAGYRVTRTSASSSTELTPAPINATSYSDSSAVPGTPYTYKIRAVDTSGNVSAYSASSASGTIPASQPVGPGTYQEDSPSIAKSGTWTPYQSSQDSGGTSVGGQSTSAYVQLTFKGTGVSWIARKNYWSGVGTVYIDGTKVAAINLYSATQVFQQVVFSKTGLSDGVHTLRIERANTNVSPSTGRDIYVDAIKVSDSVPPAAPTVLKANSDRRGVILNWSHGGEADLESIRISRQVGSGAWTEIAALPPTAKWYLDPLGERGTVFNYRFTAVDSSGNASSVVSSSVSVPKPAEYATRASSCPAATKEVTTAKQLIDAMAGASAGTVIKLAPGTYTGFFSITARGTAAKPIWICGPREAVMQYGDVAGGYGIRILDSSYINVVGMTLTNSSKGVMMVSSDHITIADTAIRNIGDEGIHFRTNTSDSVAVGNVIRDTGRVNPFYGEGVYVGSDPENWCTYTACLPDRADRNIVALNDIAGTTAEGIEAKSGTSDGTMDRNTIDGGTLSPEFGLIAAKGDRWLVIGNTGTNAQGVPFIGNFRPEYNEVGGNVFAKNAAEPATGKVVVSVNLDGDPSVSCDNFSPSGRAQVSNATCKK